MKFLNLNPRFVTRHSRRATNSARHLSLMAALLFGLLAMGCGNTLYLVQINQAEENFQEAKELGAERHAPYEYYGAQARIREAHRQAAQAEYGAASDLSDEASELANEAILKAKRVRQTAVAPGDAR